MLHFFVSQGLSERIPSLLSPTINTPGLMQWYGHLVPTAFGEFVIFMEAKSHYCLLHSVVTDKHLAELPSLFKHRLYREVVALTQSDDKLAKRIKITVQEICKSTQFSVGMDYSVSGELFEVTCALQTLLEELGGFPVPGITEFTLASHINRVSRDTEIMGFAPPMEAFRRYWLTKLGISRVMNDRPH